MPNFQFGRHSGSSIGANCRKAEHDHSAGGIIAGFVMIIQCIVYLILFVCDVVDFLINGIIKRIYKTIYKNFVLPIKENMFNGVQKYSDSLDNNKRKDNVIHVIKNDMIVDLPPTRKDHIC